LHASSVQVFPSSQDSLPPPPVQAPSTQVFPAFHTSPSQVPAMQPVPFAAFVQPFWLVDGRHLRQEFAGLKSESL
jgi:hypothetical protein